MNKTEMNMFNLSLSIKAQTLNTTSYIRESVMNWYKAVCANTEVLYKYSKDAMELLSKIHDIEKIVNNDDSDKETSFYLLRYDCFELLKQMKFYDFLIFDIRSTSIQNLDSIIRITSSYLNESYKNKSEVAV